MSAARNSRQRQWADANAGQLCHGYLGDLHDLAHDPVDPFVNHHGEEYTMGCLTHNAKLVRNNALAVDLDAFPDSAHDRVTRLLGCEDEVFLCQTVAGMHDPVGDVAIIRKEQESLRVPVEPPDGIQPQ